MTIFWRHTLITIFNIRDELVKISSLEINTIYSTAFAFYQIFNLLAGPVRGSLLSMEILALVKQQWC